MKPSRISIALLVVSLVFAPALFAQAPASESQGATPAASSAEVPRLIKFSGSLLDEQGQALEGPVGVTFALYAQQSGGAALWLETQNVKPDGNGNYTVLLGANSAHGLPAELFTSAEARWLGMQVEHRPEQPRVLLVSVPYALKASDADTLGGLPPSAFAQARANPTESSSAASANALFLPSNTPSATSLNTTADPNVTTPGGTANFMAKFDTPSDVKISQIFDNGSNVGIGFPVTPTPVPVSKLDINGGANVRGTLQLPATGAANSTTKGFNSQPFDYLASVFNGTAALNQHFRWQAEPVNPGLTTASGTLNLLFASGTGTPVETGLSINNKGIVRFATGQTFPGTGTTTSVGLSAPSSDFKVTGTPVTKSGTLALAWNVAPTSSNKPDAIVKRDSAGSFHAAQIFGDLGVEGTTALTCASCAGVSGLNTGGGLGMYAQGGGGLFATASSGVGVWGQSSGSSGGSDGVHGVTSSNGASGVAGVNTNNGVGVYGASGNAGTGVYGIALFGVQGQATDSNSAGGKFFGYAAPSNRSVGGSAGVWGVGGNGADLGLTYGSAGVYGQGGGGSGSDGAGGEFFGSNTTTGGDGIDAFAGSGYAGNFSGNVNVSGSLTKGGGSFKIDHPLDPANKYLYHSFVESPDMMNMYNGMTTLDANGEAVIQMPDWFSALNRDFRYQLTCVGGFAPVYIAEELANNQFKIGGGRAGLKVSWQVTGIRQDRWANAHRIPVEEEKNARERGFYIHPELYGAQPQNQVEWARHPQMMRARSDSPAEGRK